MKRRTPIIIALALTMAILPIYGLFAVRLPAVAKYGRLFASHVVMAKDQATFEGMKEQILILWEQMNETFQGYDFKETFNSPWYWEQTYDNSLAAQRDYFKRIVERLDSYILLYRRMVSNITNPVMLEDWYYKSIQNFRDEMEREGDLDWAIRDAWYLNFAPSCYWLGFWLIPTVPILAIITIIVIVETESYDSWLSKEIGKKREEK